MTSGPSERQQLIEYLEAKALICALDDDEYEYDDGRTLELLAAIKYSRYLEPKIYTPKSISLKLNLIEALDNNRLRQEIRMDLESFNKLYNIIIVHPIYSQNESRRRTDVKIQMIVALERLGCFDNGASIGKLAESAGVSGKEQRKKDKAFYLTRIITVYIIAGSVVNFTDRFIIAVISLVAKKYFSWPSSRQKAIIKKDVEESYGFPSCVGFVDGSLIPLISAPSWSQQDYYTRKEGDYAISCMVVCDNKMRITHLISGYTGSATDTEVFSGSQLDNFPSHFFQDGEYLLADSVYPVSLNVVPALKNPRNGQLTKDDERFNSLHASARAKIENCIGIWKSRFQCLKGLSMPVADGQDVQRINHRIKTCSMLHNFLIDNDDAINEKWYSVADEDLSLATPVVVEAQGADEGKLLLAARNGQEKRDIVKRIVLSKN